MKMMNISSDNRCAVVVNSCDKYEDAWFPFFKLTQKYWPDCPYRFYLNTESKAFTAEGINVTVLNLEQPGDPVPWGKRLRMCLSRIKSKYVILFLEDFFLQDFVNQEELNRCIEMMEQDSRYAAIYFKQIDGYAKVFDNDAKYFLMDENKMYRLNLQAGLWRKSDLEKWLRDEDSPWSFEFEAQQQLTNSDKIFLCSRAGTHTNYEGAVFPYLTGRTTGYGIWMGKWLWNNDKLFKRNGIMIKPVSLVHFTRWDMVKYYISRIREEINNKSKQK